MAADDSSHGMDLDVLEYSGLNTKRNISIKQFLY